MKQRTLTSGVRIVIKPFMAQKKQVKTSNSSYDTHKTMAKNEMLHSNLGPNGQNPLFNALNNEHYNL